MKQLIVLSFSLIFLFSCSRLNTTEDKQNIITKELSISKCKIYSADFVLLDPEDKGILLQEFHFNKKGFVHELIRYDMNGEVSGKFDIYGEHTPFPLPTKPEYIDTVLTVLEIDSVGDIVHKEVKSYNEDGQLADVSIFSSSDELSRKNSYEYNGKGMIVKDIYWDVELMKPKQVIRYEYEYFSEE